MSNQPAPQPTPILKNPQIILALISGLVTIVAAFIGVLPHLLPVPATATPTITPVILTATALPTSVPAVTNSPVGSSPISIPIQPTVISLLQPTSNVVATSLISNSINTPNVTLLYDKAVFNLINHSDHAMSLVGITFRSSSGLWDAQKWGPSIYNNLPIANCLRLRDASSGRHTPSAVCANHIYGLIEVGTSAMFWVNTDHFDVVLNDQTIATCDTAAGECDLFIPLV